MAIYCPICNKSSDDIRFVGNFCESCIIEKLKRTAPQRVTIYQCRFCKRIKEGKTFSPLNRKSLSRAIEQELKLKEHVRVRDFDEKEIKADLIYIVENEKVSFPVVLALKMGHETCRRCYQISSGYYEAVVQLRGNRMKIEKIMEKLRKFIEKREGYITKEEMVENGTDIYTSDKLATSDFFLFYRLKATRSYRLYGMKNGRKVYRNTYSMHL